MSDSRSTPSRSSSATSCLLLLRPAAASGPYPLWGERPPSAAVRGRFRDLLLAAVEARRVVGPVPLEAEALAVFDPVAFDQLAPLLRVHSSSVFRPPRPSGPARAAATASPPPPRYRPPAAA